MLFTKTAETASHTSDSGGGRLEKQWEAGEEKSDVRPYGRWDGRGGGGKLSDFGYISEGSLGASGIGCKENNNWDLAGGCESRRSTPRTDTIAKQSGRRSSADWLPDQRCVPSRRRESLTRAKPMEGQRSGEQFRHDEEGRARLFPYLLTRLCLTVLRA